MRKNAGLKSKEEMKNALDSGAVLFYGGQKICFDKERIFDGKSPYVVENTLNGDQDSVYGCLWHCFTEMEIEIPWEDELKNRKILCWVSNESETVKNKFGLIERFDDGMYITFWESKWKYATPLTEEEVKQFIL